MAMFPIFSDPLSRGGRLLLLILCLGVAGCGQGTDQEADRDGGKTAVSAKIRGPLKPEAAFLLRADYQDAGPEGRAVLGLWLRLRRTDRTGAGIKATDWSRALTVIAAKGGGESKGIRLITAPGRESPAGGGKGLYHLVYELTPPARPFPGTEFIVRLNLGGRVLISNPLTASAGPVDPGAVLRTRARVAWKLSDGPSLIRAGEDLSKAEPDSPEGWYYQGLGLQVRKEYRAALKAFLKALALEQDREKHPGEEPPAPILNRIRVLRRLLEKERGKDG